MQRRRPGSLHPAGVSGYALGLLTLALLLPAPAEAGIASQNVDVALGLGLDVSGSTDADEFGLMVNGVASAFRSPEVQAAIASGPNGRIAVSLYMWNSQGQEQDIGWTAVTPGTADAFATSLEALLDPITSHTFQTDSGPIQITPDQFGAEVWFEPVFFGIEEGKGGLSIDVGGGTGDGFGQTAVTDAIDFGAALFEDLGPFLALRRALDITGDGFENVEFDPAGCSPAAGDPADICLQAGNVFDPLTSRIFDPETYFRFVMESRDAAVASGITINGLPILTDVSDLDENFYELAVIGGDGSFSIAASGFDSFSQAISQKLRSEIAPEPSASALLLLALGLHAGRKLRIHGRSAS